MNASMMQYISRSLPIQVSTLFVAKLWLWGMIDFTDLLLGKCYINHLGSSMGENPGCLVAFISRATMF